MERGTRITKLLAMALVAIALVGIVTPVCAMVECDDIAAGTCSDFRPACDECPDAVVMKHTHDDATRVQPQAFESPTVAAYMAPLPDAAVISFLAPAPDATASPPPRDPLGVRLTI